MGGAFADVAATLSAVDLASIRSSYIDEWHDFWALVAELDEDARSSPSLVAGWTVRDVATHVARWEELLGVRRRPELPARMARYLASMARIGFSIDRLNERLAAAGADVERRPPVAPLHLFDRLAPGSQLAELVVHHQDVRRALGLERSIPGDRLVASLDGVRRLPGVGAGRRSRGLRWIADDCDWEQGEGPEVRGRGEAILLTLAGRAAAVSDLAGPGVDRLRLRGG